MNATFRPAMSFNTSNQSTTVDYSEYKNLLFSIVTLAAIGVVINLAAFAYVIYSPKIRRPLKITLFNLVGCDCIFLAGILISSLVKWDRSTLTYVCPVMTLMTLVPMPISYSAVLGLASYNFIAVFKATNFSTYITTSRALIITAVAWIVTIVTTVVSIAIGSRPDATCSVLSQMPSFMLVISAVYCIFCSFGMVVLNIAVAVKLRYTRSVSSIHNKNKVVPSMHAEDTFYNPDSPQVPQFLEVPKSLLQSNHRSSDIQTSRKPLAALNANHLSSFDKNVCLEGYQPKLSSKTSLQATKTRVYTTVSDTINNEPPQGQELFPEKIKHRMNTEDNVEMTEHPTDTGGYTQATTGTDIFPLPEISSSINTENSQNLPLVSIKSDDNLNTRVLFDLPSESNLHNQPVSLVPLRKNVLSASSKGSTSKEQICSDINDTTINFKSPGTQTSRNARQPSMPNMSAKMRTTIMTLTILAFWNAGLTLPILGMWIWMATVKNLIAQAALPWVGIALYVLVTFNAVTNPLIYAWRFVDWRKLCTHFCREGGTVTLTTGSKVMESRQNTNISH